MKNTIKAVAFILLDIVLITLLLVNSGSVLAAATYTFTLDPTGTYTFPEAVVGYGTQTAKTATIKNTGNMSGTFSITSSSSNFTLSKTTTGSLAGGSSTTFTVVPKTGLSAGTYTSTITVNGGTSFGSKTFSVSFKVLGSQTAPSAPTILIVTESSVTLDTTSGCEYSKNGTTWQTSTTFSSLTAGTQYSFYQRKAATSTLNASPSSPASQVTIGTKKTWSYSNYDYGSYVPTTGHGYPTFYNKNKSGDNYAETYVSFTLDSNNVSTIKTYNSGTNTAAPGMNLYLGLDIRSHRKSSTDMMDAYSIATSLPNPKSDLENDDLFGDRNEESEVVALGTVSARTYYMSTKWYDYRTGGSDHNGEWRAQFHMSGQYLPAGLIGKYTTSDGRKWNASSNDYNAVWISSINQAIMTYGKNGGTQ